MHTQDASYTRCGPGLPALESFALHKATDFEIKIYKDEACKTVITSACNLPVCALTDSSARL